MENALTSFGRGFTVLEQDVAKEFAAEERVVSQEVLQVGRVAGACRCALSLSHVAWRRRGWT